MRRFKKYIVLIGIIVVIIVIGARWRVVSISDEIIFDENEISKIGECQNVILLGAKIKFNGSMSPILEERAAAVVDLYESGKVCKIVISGYKESGKDYVYDEVTPVKKYFIEKGVPSEIIVSDYTGVDTFTSLVNMRDKFKLDDNVVIVTQKFHLFRAVYIAKSLEIDAVGFVAYKFPYPTKSGMYKDTIREWLAAVKAVWQSEVGDWLIGEVH